MNKKRDKGRVYVREQLSMEENMLNVEYYLNIAFAFFNPVHCGAELASGRRLEISQRIQSVYE